MTTIANLIADHNRLAAHVEGATALVKFSGSKAKLQERIDALRAQIDEAGMLKATTFTPADMARRIGANGKVLRAKIRRLRDTPNFPQPVSGNRYANEDYDPLLAAIS